MHASRADFRSPSPETPKHRIERKIYGNMNVCPFHVRRQNVKVAEKLLHKVL